MKDTISFDDFTKIDLRVGTIIEVNDFPIARNPAYILTIDFGDLGIKKSSILCFSKEKFCKIILFYEQENNEKEKE